MSIYQTIDIDIEAARFDAEQGAFRVAASTLRELADKLDAHAEALSEGKAFQPMPRAPARSNAVTARPVEHRPQAPAPPEPVEERHKPRFTPVPPVSPGGLSAKALAVTNAKYPKTLGTGDAED